MVTWIVHLRLAERLLSVIPGLTPLDFAIGSISPDSGIPDEKWETFDPPAEVLHFQDKTSSIWRIADLDFYRVYFQNVPPKSEYREQFSFLYGK
ncbi:MAG: hypothetical protein ACFFDC_00625 [Promethearchaeota archaeon]